MVISGELQGYSDESLKTAECWMLYCNRDYHDTVTASENYIHSPNSTRRIMWNCAAVRVGANAEDDTISASLAAACKTALLPDIHDSCGEQCRYSNQGHPLDAEYVPQLSVFSSSSRFTATLCTLSNNILVNKMRIKTKKILERKSQCSFPRVRSKTEHVDVMALTVCISVRLSSILVSRK